MGISYKVDLAMEAGLCFNLPTKSEQVGLSEQTLTPDGLVLPRRHEQHIEQQRFNAALGERILALYDEWRPQLYRYIRSLRLSRDQAEEVIQETFLRLTKQVQQEDEIDNVPGWIVRVAHNLAVDLLRKSDRDSPGACDHTAAFEGRVDPTPNPEEAYSKKEQIRRMMIALSGFAPRQRECFRMRARGFRYKDIALALGISEQRAALIVKQVAVRLAATCG